MRHALLLCYDTRLYARNIRPRRTITIFTRHSRTVSQIKVKNDFRTQRYTDATDLSIQPSLCK